MRINHVNYKRSGVGMFESHCLVFQLFIVVGIILGNIYESFTRY